MSLWAYQPAAPAAVLLAAAPQSLTLAFLDDSTDTLYAPTVALAQVLTLPFLDDSTDTLTAPTVTVGPVAVALPTIASAATAYAHIEVRNDGAGFVGAGAVTEGYADPLTLNWPSGYSPTAGDTAIVVAWGQHQQATSQEITPPSGFSVEANQFSDHAFNSQLTVSVKRLTGSEGGSLSQPVPSAYANALYGVSAMILVYTGVTTGITDATTVQGLQETFPVTYTPPAITTQTGDAYVLSIIANSVGSAGTLTTEQDFDAVAVGSTTTNADMAYLIAHRHLRTAGTPTMPTWTADAANFSYLLYGTLALKAEAILLPTISDGDTLYTPTVTPGPVTLTLPTISDGDTLYTPTVAPGATTLTLPHIADADGLYAPSVHQNIVLPFISSTATLYEPTVTAGGVTLVLPFISDGDTLSPPTVSPGAVTLLLATIASGEALYPMTLAFGTTLALPFISSGEVLYAPTVTPPSTSLLLPYIADSDTLYAPSLGYVIELPFIDDQGGTGVGTSSRWSVGAIAFM